MWYVRNKTNGYIVAVENTRSEAYKIKWSLQELTDQKLKVEKA